ncbi:GxxExxY protein [Balneolaceae bacterium YR4-1]|uniref:GxxExxY protein n=1 Tax=Halalkalibaculum roseum TaxID=2709311 RepID=A0A6M1SRI7_9BACT|nr:GxxExxY protein [Halalkalibaculum roseum]
MKHRELSSKIIKAFYEVYNELGPGFIESVYESALSLVLIDYGFSVKRQYPIEVYFREKIIGEFRADILVEEKVILELKSVSKIRSEHKAQLINYLKATDIDLGLLLNFGDKTEFQRYIFDKRRKPHKYP